MADNTKDKAPYSSLGVMLLAFGGPECLDSVEPFLKSVMPPGRPVTKDQVEKALARYKLIGGSSPLLAITKKQAAALNERLAKKFKGLRVYVGMRHWHPFIKDTLKEMINDGISKAIAVSMAPHKSKASTGGYAVSVNNALKESGNPITVEFVKSWHKNPCFIEALSTKIRKGLLEFPEGKREDVHIIFSAHSLPEIMVKNDPYVEEINETIKGVLDKIGQKNWRLAYQSKGGGKLEWLGPEVETVFEELSEKGVKDVLVVPVGFVSDHVETLYDIDILCKDKAQSLGLNFKRTESLNDSKEFIGALFEVISEHIEKMRGEN